MLKRSTIIVRPGLNEVAGTICSIEQMATLYQFHD